MRVAPTATVQIPPTMIRAASVAPGAASARTPRGIWTRPNSSRSHQSGRTLRAAKAPEMAIVPITISHEPRKMPSTVRLGDGQAMIATPAATESSPVTTLAARPAIPTVSIAQKPSKMNRAPMKAARLLTLQSMLKIRTPARINRRPLSSSRVQLLDRRSAAAWVSLRPNESNDAGVTNMVYLHLVDLDDQRQL